MPGLFSREKGVPRFTKLLSTLALLLWAPLAAAQNNLGGAYAQLSTWEKAANLSRAVACYEAALQFRTPEAAPDVCRKSNYNLANLYFAQKEWNKALETYQARTRRPAGATAVGTRTRTTATCR